MHLAARACRGKPKKERLPFFPRSFFSRGRDDDATHYSGPDWPGRVQVVHSPGRFLDLLSYLPLYIQAATHFRFDNIYTINTKVFFEISEISGNVIHEHDQ